MDPIELRKNVAALAVMVFVLADMPEPLVPPPGAAAAAAAMRPAAARR